MISNRFLSRAAVVVALSAAATVASATPIDNSASGLSGTTALITFDEHVLPQDTQVTTQYADRGVTFVPGLYYSPDDPDEHYYTSVIDGHFLGNYSTAQDPALLASITLKFGSTQTRAAFGFASNSSNYTFSSYLGNTQVESFTANVVTFGYFGFTGSLFDSIVIKSLGSPDANEAGYPDFFDLDNIQFDVPALLTLADIGPSRVPEPAVDALLGLGLVAALAMRRRSALSRAA